VAYRDENEVLRGRVAELERRLALADALIARLTGKDASSRVTRRPDSIVGAVVHHVDEVRLDVGLAEDGLAAATRVAEQRLGLVVTRLGAELRGRRSRLALLGERGGEGALSIGSAREGSTLRLETDLRRLPIVVALGPVMGALCSAPLILWQINELHHFQPTVSAMVTLPIVVLLMVLGTLVARGVANRLARAEGERHQGVWASLLEIAREQALAQPRVRTAAVEESDEGGEEQAFERGQVRRAVRSAP